jgi:hypothetical protein
MQRVLKRKYLFISGVVISVLALLAAAGWVLLQYNKTDEPTNTFQSSENPISTAGDTVSKVSALIDLPQDEQPSLARITDEQKVRSEKFLSNAQNGDIVLIYEKARKAILYRESTNKVIEVATLQQNEATASGSESPSQTEEIVAVSLLNGTGKKGLAASFEPQIKGIVPNAEITTGNAGNAEYKKTVLVVLDSGVQEQANKLAESLGIAIESLPEGERSGGQILIILGADKVN